MQQIIFDPPDSTSPGFLRRLKTVGRLQALFRSGQYTEEDVDNLANFLLGFVTEPADREEALELLWDASQEQLLAMMDAIGGESKEDAPLAEQSK